MNKKTLRYILIVCIMLLIYNVLVWVIPFPKKDITTFVISYVASLFAIIAQPIIYGITIKENDILKSKIYGWPIVRVGYIYCIIQLLISVVIYVIGAFLTIPCWIPIVLCVVLFGLSFIGMIITDTYKNEIKKIEECAPETKKFVLDLRLDVEMLSRKNTNEPLHSKLMSFAELVKYSDPVSCDALNEIEDEINRKYIEIKELIRENKEIEAINKLNEIYLLMEERNQRCKSTKNN